MNIKRSRIDKNQTIDRRTFLKELGLIPLLPLLPACQWATKEFPSSESDFFSMISPINRTIQDHSFFSGDDFSRPHHILWDKKSYIESIGGLTKPIRKEELVIIGGGMSGLMSAYLLRDKKPVILEQASRFGGNAKGEAWKGLQYSIGAAYLIKPDQDSGPYKLLKDLGIINHWTLKRGGEGNV